MISRKEFESTWRRLGSEEKALVRELIDTGADHEAFILLLILKDFPGTTLEDPGNSRKP